jgi:DNA-binding GntR family transcriptional regulator
VKDVLGHRLEMAQLEHRQIMDAFRNRDAQEVERLIRAHNHNALAAYNNYLQAAGYLGNENGDC